MAVGADGKVTGEPDGGGSDGEGASDALIVYNLDPASTRMRIAQPLDPYSEMKILSNHNKDSTRFFIRSTNQYVALGNCSCIALLPASMQASVHTTTCRI